MDPLLDTLLRWAEERCTAHATILDLEEILVLRAPTSPFYRRMVDKVASGEAGIVAPQKMLHEFGLVTVQPVFIGLPTPAWRLHNVSGLGEAFPTGRGRFETLADVLVRAIEWWRHDHANRQVIVPRAAVEDEKAKSRQARISDTDRLNWIIEKALSARNCSFAREALGVTGDDLAASCDVTRGDAFREAVDRAIRLGGEVVR